MAQVSGCFSHITYPFFGIKSLPSTQEPLKPDTSQATSYCKEAVPCRPTYPQPKRPLSDLGCLAENTAESHDLLDLKENFCAIYFAELSI